MRFAGIARIDRLFSNLPCFPKNTNADEQSITKRSTEVRHNVSFRDQVNFGGHR